MESKFKRAFTRTTAVLFAALLLGTSAYVPQAVHIVPTSIVANAVEETSVPSTQADPEPILFEDSFEEAPQ